ncbi:hypothetical protein D9M71_142180 [compost metagenome]
MGDYTQGVYADGSIQKIMIHAMVGGLLAEASGGDFKTGALAGGANEALVDQLNTWVGGDQNLLNMTSQLVGVLAAATLKDADIDSLNTGKWVAENATQYNYLNHTELAALEKESSECKAKGNCAEVKEKFRALSVANDDQLASICAASPAMCIQQYNYLVNERQASQLKIEDIYSNDAVPFSIKMDLPTYNLQNINATGTVVQAGVAQNLLEKGVSQENASLAAAIFAAVAGGMAGKAKVPPKLQPFTNPPQGPVIPAGWISRPGRTSGSTIYYPPGTDPSAPGGTYIRLMPSGSTPVPGLENGYWISVKNGQPINPATGGTGTRGETHVPLPPNTVPPKR